MGTGSVGTKYFIYPPRNPRKMTFLIWVFGTRGDCQPMLHLASILQAYGHRAILAAPPERKDWIIENGIEYWEFPVNSKLVDELLSLHANAGISSWKTALTIPKTVRYLNDLFHAASTVVRKPKARDIDVMISPNWYLFGPHIAEFLRVPYVEAQFFPNTKNSEFDLYISEESMRRLHLFLPWMSGRWSKITYDVTDRFMGLIAREPIAKLRKILHLRAMNINQILQRMHSAPIIYAVSPNVIKKPLEWTNHVHLVGYWVPPMSGHGGWEPSASLVEFFNGRSYQDKRPIAYMDLGSMTKYPNTQKKMIAYLKSITNDDIRWIIATGPSDGLLDRWLREEWIFSRDKSTVFLKTEPIPHTWLIPKIDAFIHHGGAGTCAAGFYAGTPSIITPILGDQVQNCQFAAKKGVGICTSIHPKKFDLETLVHELINDQAYKKNALELKESLESENPAYETMKAILHEVKYISRTGDQFPGQYKSTAKYLSR